MLTDNEIIALRIAEATIEHAARLSEVEELRRMVKEFAIVIAFLQPGG